MSSRKLKLLEHCAADGLTALDVIAATFYEQLIQEGEGELADDFLEWWIDNRPRAEGE